MANWKEAINIAGLHRLFTTGAISLQDLSRAVVRKLKNTEVFAIAEPELVDIMCAFDAIDELAQFNDYTTALDMLYSFGNKDNRLWIEADDTSSSEHEEVPVKTRNPFEENKDKTPYLSPASTVKPTNTSTTDSPATTPWSKDKVYNVGDLVSKGGIFKCLISCAGVDPGPNSANRPGDCWKWISSEPKVSFDPALAFTDRITCTIPSTARVYPATRKYHYMSEDDFNKKLTAAEINPANLPKELYTYMKDCEEPYQQWLIERWHKNNLTFRIPDVA